MNWRLVFHDFRYWLTPSVVASKSPVAARVMRCAPLMALLLLMLQFALIAIHFGRTPQAVFFNQADLRSSITICWSKPDAEPFFCDCFTSSILAGIIYWVMTSLCITLLARLSPSATEQWRRAIEAHRNHDQRQPGFLFGRLTYGNDYIDSIGWDEVMGVRLELANITAAKLPYIWWAWAAAYRRIFFDGIVATIWGMLTRVRPESDVTGYVAYQALLAGEPDKAIELSRKALALSPKTLWLQSNLAHGLLLTGQVEQARHIYLRNVGQQQHCDEGCCLTVWNDMIKKDFEEMRQAGCDQILIEEIERAIRNAQGQ